MLVGCLQGCNRKQQSQSQVAVRRSQQDFDRRGHSAQHPRPIRPESQLAAQDQDRNLLGLLIDSAQERFLLPEDKRLDIMHLAETIMQQLQVSNRQLARMAGKMIAAAPAIQLSKLYAGAMYKVMTRELD